MRHPFEVRGPIAILAVGLASSWSATAAFAACTMASVGGGGSGPPSISATETSTAQVLEQVRRRTQEAQTPQPIPVSNSSAAEAAAPDAKPEPKPAAAASSTSAANASAAEPAVKTKSKTVKQAKAAEPEAEANTSHPPSLKDYGVVEERSIAGNTSRTSAVWAQGFLSYDRHSNTAPGNQENPTRSALTGGGLVGADWTHVNHGETVEAFQFGVFSGYSGMHAKFSDTTFKADDIAPFAQPQVPYARTNNAQDNDGPFVGTYAAYVADRWTFDAAFKVDFMDLSQHSTLSQVPSFCGGAFDTGTQTGSASLTDYVIAVNAAHRNDLSANSWFEPTAGLRFTYSDFSNDVSTSVFKAGGVQTPGRLGLEDGSALRLQVGARLGNRTQTEEGYIWTTTLGAFLYSDVLITGFKSVSGQTGEAVGPVDEGKVRGLGQFESRLDVGNGVSYLLQAEVRGGSDVFGAAGQIGVRYEW